MAAASSRNPRRHRRAKRCWPRQGGRPKVRENQKGKRGDLLIREVSVRGVVSWSTSYDEKEEIELIRKRAGFLPSMTIEDLPRFLAKALCGRQHDDAASPAGNTTDRSHNNDVRERQQACAEREAGQLLTAAQQQRDLGTMRPR